MRFQYLRYFCWYLLISFTSPVLADSLLDIYELAKKNDPNYQITLAQHQATLEKKPQLFSYLLPNISAHFNKNSSDNSMGNSEDSNTSITITQPIYNKATFYNLTKADQLIERSELTIKQNEQNLIIKVTNAYFNLLQTLDTLETTQKDMIAIKQQLNNIQKKFDVGSETQTSLAEAQARYDLAVANTVQADTAKFIAKEKLTEIINKANPILQPLKINIPLKKPDPEAVEIWVAMALKNNLTLKIKQSLLESAQEEVGLQRAGHYPTLNLSATTSDVQSDNPVVISGENNKISLQFNLPIFNGGMISSKIKEAQYKLQISKDQLSSTRRQIIRKTRELYSTIVSTIKQIKATEASLKSAIIALNANEVSFKEGVRTSTDVLNSRSQVFKAKSNLTKLRYRYLSSHLNLKQVAGILNTQDLVKINNLLINN